MKKYVILGALFLAFFMSAAPLNKVLADTYAFVLQPSPAGLYHWSTIASSSDGTRLAGADNSGNIYTGVNSGSGFVWTAQTFPGPMGPYSWSSIALSSDGTKLVAADSSGYIWTATDSGSGFVWTAQFSLGSHVWTSVASSSDGTKLVAVSSGTGGHIYTGVNSGSGFVWTDQSPAGLHYWSSVASSSDGTKLAATDYEGYIGYIYTGVKTGSSVVWTAQSSIGSAYWLSIASSSDGTKLAVTDNVNGRIYTGVNSGSGFVWTYQYVSVHETWGFIASSSDGTKLAAVSTSTIITGVNSGSGFVWTTQTPAGAGGWKSIASSSDGTRLAVVSSDGSFYLSVIPAVVTNAATSVTQTTALLHGTLMSTGKANTTVSFSGYASGTLGSVTPSTIAATGTTPTSFSAPITGLSCGTPYTFNATATNAGGSVSGGTVNFTTMACVGVSHAGDTISSGTMGTTATSISAPTVVTNTITAVTPTSATLSGTLTSTGGAATTVSFEITPSSGSSGTIAVVTPAAFSASSTGGSFTATVSGLTCSTSEYIHVRAKAVNSAGTAYGNSIGTWFQCPWPATNPATSITQTSAVLNGSVSPVGTGLLAFLGTVWDSFSASGGTVATASPESFPTLSAAGAFTAALSGLTCNTSYTFTAQAAEEVGADSEVFPSPTTLSFTTLPCGSASSKVTNPGTTTDTYASIVSGSAAGDTGSNVANIQKVLIAAGYMTAPATGTYDTATTQAVMAFQKAQGLSPVGSVGPKTTAAMNAWIATTTTAVTAATAAPVVSVPTCATGAAFDTTTGKPCASSMTTTPVAAPTTAQPVQQAQVSTPSVQVVTPMPTPVTPTVPTPVQITTPVAPVQAAAPAVTVTPSVQQAATPAPAAPAQPAPAQTTPVKQVTAPATTQVKPTAKLGADALGAFEDTSTATAPSGTQPSVQSSTLFTQPLHYGSTGDQVTALQNFLQTKGYLKVAPTGFYGRATERAVIAFQSDNNLPAVGYVGPETRAVLNK